MTYPYPGNIAVIAQLLVDKISGHAASFVIPFTSADVYYGDQNIIPRTPTVCVEPDNKQRRLAGVPNMTENDFTIFILVYINKVQELQVSRKQADNLAYDIEQYIHQDLELKNGGSTPNLIHGYVISSESGFVFKQGTLYRSARLTYHGLSKTSLPVA